MLKQRVITGVILAALVISLILILPSSLFNAITLVVFIGIGGWEWSRLTGINDSTKSYVFIAVLATVALIGLFFSSFLWPFILLVGGLWWFVVLGLLASYQPNTSFYKQNTWLLKGAAFLTLVVSWWFIQKLHGMNPLWLLYLIFLISITDIAAYFTGKAFGKRKLAPMLSPGKTLEGAAGGMFAAGVAAGVMTLIADIPNVEKLPFVMLSLVTAALSIVGDLFESLIKREAGMKDSGTILPGHGGVLDRIDSLLAALPFFTIGLAWLQLQGSL